MSAGCDVRGDHKGAACTKRVCSREKKGGYWFLFRGINNQATSTAVIVNCHLPKSVGVYLVSPDLILAKLILSCTAGRCL